MCISTKNEQYSLDNIRCHLLKPRNLGRIRSCAPDDSVSASGSSVVSQRKQGSL